MGYKYSALLIPSIPFFPKVVSKVNLGSGVFLERGYLKDYLVVGESDHWKDWLGKLNWESLNEEMIFLVATSESETPEILDKENRDLDRKVFRAYDVMLLVAPFLPPTSQPFAINGRAEVSSDEIKFKDIRSYSRLNTWRKSFYSTECSDEVIKWELQVSSDINNFVLWEKVLTSFNSLVQDSSKLPYLIESYRSFREAFYSHHLEFKIPNLTRSIESLIALGRAKNAGGWENFVSRTFSLIKAMPSVPIINVQEEFLRNDLKELYYVRNDCSHGKLITDSLSSMEQYKDGVTPGHIALLEMLAESSARYILRSVLLGNAITPYCDSRAKLEQAWETGKLP
ncbi:MAG: hypothetical protein K2P81_00630 [Bacteriovoracaceae bacterium]|nr:hypothetical protein [Bacteriovoracaceae bacterium]